MQQYRLHHAGADPHPYDDVFEKKYWSRLASILLLTCVTFILVAIEDQSPIHYDL